MEELDAELSSLHKALADVTDAEKQGRDALAAAETRLAEAETKAAQQDTDIDAYKMQLKEVRCSRVLQCWAGLERGDSCCCGGCRLTADGKRRPALAVM